MTAVLSPRPAADLLHEARSREHAACIPEAISGYEAAIADADRAGERVVLAEALRRLAVVRHHRNESAVARALCDRSFAVAREAGNDVLAAEALNTHHERYDGTGYPDRLRGDEIPVSAQVVGVVDVYDALTTSRPYRKAMTQEAAVAEITRCRSWWSDQVYIAFVEALTEAP